MLKNLAIFVSILPLFIIIYSIFKLIINQTLIQFKYVFGIIFATISVQILKKINWPKCVHKFTMRPKGACDCDYLSIKGLCPDNTPGFPSGHMSTTSFFVINNILNLIKNNNPNKNFYIFLNIVFLLLMGWARIYKKCHNLFQVCIGTLYGGIIGYVFN